MKKEKLIEPDRMSVKELALRLGLSERTIWRMHKRKQLPAFRRFSSNVVGLLRADYYRWLASRPKLERRAEAK